MSKLKVTTISDPDNDNTAISVGTDGTITVAQNATFSGNISVSGSIPAAQLTGTLPALDGSALTGIGGGSNKDDAFHATRTSSHQSTNDSTWTTVVCNTEKFDYGSNYNTSNGDYTVPETGFYFFYAGARLGSWDANKTVQVHLDIRYNDSDYISVADQLCPTSNGYDNKPHINCSGAAYLTSGDTVQCYFWIDTSDGTQTAFMSGDQTYFGGFKLLS